MTTQEYISSGIIESYVLGLATDQERAEFERMCAAHTEVRAARDEFERNLELQSLKGAVKPPSNLRSKIFAELEIEKEKLPGNSFDQNAYNNSNTQPAPVVTMNPWMKYVAVAAVLLLVTSTILNFYFFNQYKSITSKYEGLVQQNAEIAKNNQQLQVQYNETMAALEKLSDPAMAIIKMAGNAVSTSPSPNSMATVYWDTRTKDVYLRINNLPEASSDKQYQLWAIVDGKPVDAGVFDIVKGVPVITMKNIPSAQLFAITLEKKGGSPTPEGPMYVMGKVS